MKCVVCSGETIVQEHEGVTADVCVDGHGLWLLPKELLIAIRTDPNAGGRSNSWDEEDALDNVGTKDVETDDEVRECPNCDTQMNSVQYAFSTTVIVDCCASHGLWLDAGELEAIEGWAAERFAPTSESAQAFRERADQRDIDAADPYANETDEKIGFFAWARIRFGRG